jgi:hypothetical protein
MVFKKGESQNWNHSHWTGRNHTEETKERMSIKASERIRPDMIGNKWGAGKKYSANPISNLKQSPYRYNILVKRLLCPEGKCQTCGKSLGWSELQLHHEDIFNRQPETVDINSLKILCPKCHKLADINLWRNYKALEKVA